MTLPPPQANLALPLPEAMTLPPPQANLALPLPEAMMLPPPQANPPPLPPAVRVPPLGGPVPHPRRGLARAPCTRLRARQAATASAARR
jgi:hypothetical protein